MRVEERLKIRLKPKLKWLAWIGIIVFVAAVGIEQTCKYFKLRSQIGSYAYSISYARRQIGEEHAYIGRVIDIRWNALREQPDDVKGFQPQYLIARETVADVTEEQWWCAYLFICKPTPPLNFKPAPFPKIKYWTHAVR